MKKLLLAALLFGSLIGIADYAIMTTNASSTDHSKSSRLAANNPARQKKFQQMKHEFTGNLKFYDLKHDSVITKDIVVPKSTRLAHWGMRYYKDYVFKKSFHFRNLNQVFEKPSLINRTTGSAPKISSQVPVSTSQRSHQQGASLPADPMAK